MKGNAEPRAFADPEDAGKDRGRYSTPSLWLSRGDHRDLGSQLADDAAGARSYRADGRCLSADGFWVGQLQITGFLVFSIIGLAIVPPGRAIVLAYTMPLWAMPIGLGLSREVLPFGKVAGVTIGFAGLVLFMNPALIDWTDPRAVAGNSLLLLAAICWAAGSCLYQRHPWQSNFWAQTFWQLAVGAVTIIALAVVLEPDWSVDWSPGFVAILVYNWVVTTALGYLLWNKVLAMMSPVMAGQVLTLTPISGFFLSTMIFGGAVTVDVVASILLIAIGLVLTLRR